MKLLDSHPFVNFWNSECIQVWYINPFIKDPKKRKTYYLPDFFVQYTDKSGKSWIEMIEVKPKEECPGYTGKVSPQKKMAQALNYVKWQAAIAYCKRAGWKFRVMTAEDMFGYQWQ